VNGISSDHPLVSVIISSYNYQQYVAHAINSVLEQSYQSIEIIVVDDGSSDGSPQIIKEYREKITPIVKSNGGQASALNAGFLVSHGDIICFLASDDWLFRV
jgi:glycosyltransferase involved in cell wall biosynthesis